MSYLKQFNGSGANLQTNTVVVVHPNGSFQSVQLSPIQSDSSIARYSVANYISAVMATNGMNFGLSSDSSGKVIIDSIDGVSNSGTHYWEIRWNGAHSDSSLDEVLGMQGQTILIRYVPIKTI